MTIRYEIRYYPEFGLSHYVGYKHRLLKFRQAVKVVKKLKKSGIDAFHCKYILD